MKNTQKNEGVFSTRMVFLTFLFIFAVGSFGLATVGLRQQIASSASQTVEMERRLEELRRSESQYTGEIAMAISPDRLEAQNERFDLGLRQPQENQVIRVDRDTQIRFAERRWNDVASAPDENAFTFHEAESN